MYLHEDKKQFDELIRRSAKVLHMNPCAIEKDYYVITILKELNKRLDNLPYEEAIKGLKTLIDSHLLTTLGD